MVKEVRSHWALRLTRVSALCVVGLFAVGCGSGQPSASPAPFVLKTHGTSVSLPIVVVGGNGGNDLQVQSGETGRTIRDLGPVNQFTSNGLALSPDRRAVYVVVDRSRTIMIERVDLTTGAETFVADGFTPAISQDGRFLSYATGPGPPGAQELVVENLATHATRAIDLQELLGQQTDLLNASIRWLGSRIVIVPGGVGNDLMGGPLPTPLEGSCSAAPRSAACLIVVDAEAGRPLSAKQVVFHHLNLGMAVLGASGTSALEAAADDGNRTDVSLLTFSDGRNTVTHLFSVPFSLAQSFSSNGAELFYLVSNRSSGDGLPVALWEGDVTSVALTNARLLNPNIDLSALAG
jgi:hypothetical protein